MKRCLLPIVFVVCAHGATQVEVPTKNLAAGFAQHAREADRVVFPSFSPAKEPSVITVKDRVWIFSLARVLAEAVFEPQDHIFAMSAPITFLDKEGRKVLEIEILPGGVLRVQGTDYRVGAKTNGAIVELLKEKANQTSEPTAPSGRGSP